jgi:N-acetylmuramoyl-L-alanine amidase
MVKIGLDDGHGIGTPGKRTDVIPELGRQVQENEFNREVVKYLDAELKRSGFQTVLTAVGDSDVPLATRVKIANDNKVDLFISIHFNALTGSFATSKAEGFSAHVYKGQLGRTSGQFAKIAVAKLAMGTQQKNRGVVEQDLYVTRETNMPAVLFELGFMDNLREARLMLNVAFQKECAREIAQACCQFYGVGYVPEPVPKPVVVVPPAPVVKSASTANGHVHRVLVDGVQVGAFDSADGIANLVKTHVEKNVKKIEIVLV